MSKYIYLKNTHKSASVSLNVTKFKELDASIVQSENKEKKVATISIPANGVIYQFLNDELLQNELAIHKNVLKEATNEIEKVLSNNNAIKELQEENKALKEQIKELQEENKSLKR